MQGLGLQNRQPHPSLKCGAAATSPVPWLPRTSSLNHEQDALTRSQSSYAGCRALKRVHKGGKGLPPLGCSSMRSRMHSTSPGRLTTGFALANQTWSTGDRMRQAPSSALVASRYRPGDTMMRQTWSTGLLPSNDRNNARRSPSDCMRQTWSMGCLQNYEQHLTGSSATAAPRWAQRAASKGLRQGFARFGLPIWDSLLQVLPLVDAGALAAVSRVCSLQLQRDLTAAGNQTRRCKACGSSFSYLTGGAECWYHPGKEHVNLVGDGPGSGMMDVSWSCCGRGAAYAVGIAMACTRSEVPGCCARKHRARPCATREPGGSCYW